MDGETYYSKNKEYVLCKAKLTHSANQALKTYTMFGKLKVVELPPETLAILHARFKVDESSETGLRWIDSNINRPDCRGKEAGYLKSNGYYNLEVEVNSIRYDLGVARLIWMMVNNRIIEPGMVINHINRKRHDNRIANLEVTTRGLNKVNCAKSCSSSYKNVNIARRKPSTRFYTRFAFLGITYRTKHVKSEDYALILGWKLITSGEVPLEFIKSQFDEWKDGTYLQRALAECKKQGIAVKRPKYKTLYEYIASVEGSC
jgi:hypothetical protein